MLMNNVMLMNGTQVNRTLQTSQLSVVQNLNETQTHCNCLFHSFYLLLRLCKVSFVAVEPGDVRTRMTMYLGKLYCNLVYVIFIIKK